MAHKDMKRYGESAQKKVLRATAIEVTEQFFKSAGDAVSAGTFNYLVAKLPAHAAITKAYVAVDEATTVATSAQVALGSAEGGAQLLALTDVKTVGHVGAIANEILTGTGMDLYMQVKLVGAVSKLGRFTVVVEYTEYAKNSGEYTQF